MEDEHEAVLAPVADVEQFGADAVFERAADERARLLAVVACALGVRLPGAVPAYVGVKDPVAVSTSPRSKAAQAPRSSSMSLADMSAVSHLEQLAEDGRSATAVLPVTSPTISRATPAAPITTVGTVTFGEIPMVRTRRPPRYETPSHRLLISHQHRGLGQGAPGRVRG